MVKTWIIGCGSIGKRVNQLLQQQKVDVYTFTRNHKMTSIFENLNINSFIADLDDKDSLNTLSFEKADIYYFAPPSKVGDRDIRIANFINSLKINTPPKRIVYISTTGVYGDCNSEWVTENSPTSPKNARSKRRLSAEQLIQSFCKKSSTEYIILRVPGIYCEQKLPLDRIKNGVTILSRDIAPASNRIHAMDLTRICIAAMQSPHQNCILNVADGNPSSISDYFIQTAKLFDLPPPREIGWEQAKKELSKEMLSYLTESKKINPSQLLKTLNIQLQYPTLEAGLRACKDEIEHR